MKFLRYFTLFICGVAFVLGLNVLPQRLCFAQGDSYTFYCGDTSRNCRVIQTNTPELKKPFLREINGESTHFESLDVAKFIADLNGEVLFVEELTDSKNYYCSADLPYAVQLYGQTVNLHVCVKEDGVTVASPIIFGGY